jgi:hypothetical protein
MNLVPFKDEKPRRVPSLPEHGSFDEVYEVFDPVTGATTGTWKFVQSPRVLNATTGFIEPLSGMTQGNGTWLQIGATVGAAVVEETPEDFC